MSPVITAVQPTFPGHNNDSRRVPVKTAISTAKMSPGSFAETLNDACKQQGLTSNDIRRILNMGKTN